MSNECRVIISELRKSIGWREMSKKTLIGKDRLERILKGEAVPTPREEHDIKVAGEEND